MSDNNLIIAYLASNIRLRVNELEITYIVALILMPLGITMDLIVYPDAFHQLVSIRIYSVILLLAGYHFHKYLQKNTGYNRHLTYFEFFSPCQLIYRYMFDDLLYRRRKLNLLCCAQSYQYWCNVTVTADSVAGGAMFIDDH
jgi:hypothetical protein